MPPADHPGTLTGRRRALIATLGSGADLAARQGAQFLIAVVLARLISPSDFGAVALLGILVAVGVVVADLGLMTTLLQADELADEDLDVALSLSIASGLATTVVVAALAWPVAGAFGLEGDAPVAAVMSLAIAASAVGLAPTAVLIRRTDFSRLLVSGLLAALVAGGVGIILAILGSGIWSLAAVTVLTPVVVTLAVFVLSPVRHRARWDSGRARRLLSRGRWVLAANVLDTGWARVQYAAIGSLFGTASLGHYQRADTTQQIANDATSTVVGRVALPVFARSSSSPALLRTGFGTGVAMTTAFSAPAMVLMASLAEPLLLGVFGPQWQPAAPLLVALCVGGLLWPVHLMAINVLYAASKNSTVFRIDVVKKVAALGLLVVGARFGLLGVAWATAIFGIVAAVVNGVAVRRTIGLPIRAQLSGWAPSVALAVSVGVAVALVSRGWSPAPLVEVLALGTAGLVCYGALGLALRTPVRDVVVLLRHREGDAR